jgi:hypothetical protein
MYEPFVSTLSEHLLMPLPAWRAGAVSRENWRSSAWGQAHRADPHDPHDD